MADRKPLSEVVDKEPEKGPKPEGQDKRQATSNEEFVDEVEYHRIANFFDLDLEERNNNKLKSQLEKVYDWARKQTDSNKRIDNLMHLKSIKRSLGFTNKGSDMIKKLYKYIRLDQDRQRIEKEMELINEQ